MKKKWLLTLSLISITASLVGCGSVEHSFKGSSKSANNGKSVIASRAPEYYMPQVLPNHHEYEIQLFKIYLSGNGYQINGVEYTNYNTNNINTIENITPQSVIDYSYRFDINLFNVNDSHLFLKVEDTIYRFDPGKIKCMFMWDYDTNGVPDIFTYSYSGSGRLFHGVDFFDMTTHQMWNVFKQDITDSMDKPEFAIKEDNLFLDNQRLVYAQGKFYCANYCNALEPVLWAAS